MTLATFDIVYGVLGVDRAGRADSARNETRDQIARTVSPVSQLSLLWEE